MRRASLLFYLFAFALAAQASGPRFVTGVPFFNTQGQPIGWRGPQLLYSTDPGDLSPNVNHAAADALVAAAAGVWNLPVASLTIAQGAPLAEHVSAQNVYFGATGLQFPADVSTVPLAILYDTDGSVTDTLLGSGASLPSGCRQNAVTESVDAFDPAGYIKHAIIVINGRCTGTAPAAQLQLRYQLMRVFGRVLGLAWSQTNDNVFTGQPTPTPIQAQNWPIMHPIDILCGLYTYQCLPNPFTLRIDDIAGMVAVYPIDGSQPIPAGKQLSYTAAQGLQGLLSFPTGEGMAGVNVLVRRIVYGSTIPDAFFVSSGVSGWRARLGGSSPFVTPAPGPEASFGSIDPGDLGKFLVPWFPIPNGASIDNRITSTEPVNPLYAGEYSLGPYPAGAVQPSGSTFTQTNYIVGAGLDYLQIDPASAATTCGNGSDGTPGAPMQTPPTGWWNGLTCGFGHVAYGAAVVRPHRTFTLEVTALDATGLATTTKLMPVLGLFAATDNPPYNPPSLAATVTAFNGLTVGTTTLHAGTGTSTQILYGIADQRNDGRPDYNYQARLFYADQVTPAQLATTGGTITINGLGFRQGNAVTVNGLPATVLSWTANTIIATAPASSNTGPVDITITDRGTGATSTITAALTYSPTAQPASMRLVSEPTGTLYSGDPASTAFTVQLLAADGTTPVRGIPVTFSGPVTFASPAVVTDANGLATTQLTPTSSGSVTIQAIAGTLAQTATFQVLEQATRLTVYNMPENPLTVGTQSSSGFGVQSFDANGFLSYRQITFTATSGSATFAPCYAATCTITANYFGGAMAYIIPQSVGNITIQARDGDITQSITIQALSSAYILTTSSAPSTQFYPGQQQSFFVKLTQADGISPVYSQPVTFTAPPGVTFDQCAQQTCPIVTNGGGLAWVNLNVPAPGTYTVTATWNGQTQSATFTVIPRQWQIKVLSVPADNSPTGVSAALPFRVQVVTEDGITPAPIAGRSVILSGPNNAVILSNCGASACEIWLGSDATATAWVVPQQPGPITLSAVYAPLVATATFTAVGGSRSMQVVLQPGAGGAPIQRESDIIVQVLGPDGVTPLGGDSVSFDVLSGPYLFYEGFPTYKTNTDGYGNAFVPGLATGYGPVVVRATDGVVTRLITFQAGTPPQVMQLVSTPPSPSTTGTPATRPFTIQLFASDGVTPAPNVPITFTLTTGTATFANCSSTICIVTTDAQGLASVQVTPLSAGVIGLLAADGLVTQPVLFTTVNPADILHLLSAPADGSFTGVPAPTLFAVQVLLGDGVTPAAGKPITLTVLAGAATFPACATPCTLIADSSGTISTPVTPTTTGPITLQALDGQNTVTTTFNAVARPDVLHLLSAPADGSFTGVPAPTPFAVQVLLGDGVTPAAGKPITLTFLAGAATFPTCANPCTLIADANGTISTPVIPTAAGPVTLQAADVALTLTATFTAATRPDTMQLLTAPAGTQGIGYPSAMPFTIRVLHGDGTPVAGKSIAFSASPASVRFIPCSAEPCTVLTAADGTASVTIIPLTSGPITLTATEATLTQSATFTAANLPDILHVLSAPASAGFAGLPSAGPFTIQAFLADGITPATGKAITLTVAAGTATFPACPTPCTLIADPNGTISTPVTPTSVGTITLQAADGATLVTATFTTFARPDTLRLISAPTGTLPTGLPASSFSVQLLQGDGTPDPAKLITFTAQNAQLSCTFPCPTAQDGTAAAFAIPTSPGPVTLTATYGTLTQTITFTAYTRPDTLKLISAPTSGGAPGIAAAIPFTVQVLAGDGTPAPGRSVTLTVPTGTAIFPACPTPCTLIADTTGIISTPVTPTSTGTITLLATNAQATVSVTFTTLANHYTLSPLNPNLYVAEASVSDVVLTTQATENALPGPGQPVTWTGTPGLQPAAATTLTDATGTTVDAATAGPLSAGTSATATACAWQTTCTTFTLTGISADSFYPTILTGATLSAVTLAITDGTHLIAGAPLTIYQTVTAYAPCPPQGRCPAAPILASLVTAATSDAAGHYTFTPLTVAGQPTQTEIAISAGTSGFITTTLVRQP